MQKQLFGRAALDGDVGAARAPGVDRGGGSDDHEADPVVAGAHREGVGTDLVRDVAIGGDPVRADDDPAHPAPTHRPGRRAVGDHAHRDPLLDQLVGGEPRALEPGPRFAGEDVRDPARGMSGPDHAERGAEAGGRERTRVAVGEHVAARLDERGAERPHAPVRGNVRVMQGARGLEQDGLRVGAGRRRVDRTPHALQRPAEIDRGGASRREAFEVVLDALAPRGGRLRVAPPRREHHAIRGCHPDRGSAAHDHRPNRLHHVRALGAALHHRSARQNPLIEKLKRSVLPLDRIHRRAAASIAGQRPPAERPSPDSAAKPIGASRWKRGPVSLSSRDIRLSFPGRSFSGHSLRPIGTPHRNHCAMRSVDTLVEARWVIPVEPEGVVLEHHSVVIDSGRIRAILPHEQARSAFAPSQTIELADHVLLPGLVNAHTHAGMTLMRGFADDLPLMPWLEEHIWPVEGRWVSEEFVRDGTMLAVAEMLRGGTTCFNDMYFYPNEAGRAAAAAGMRCMVGMIVLDFPTVWAASADEYLARATEVHDTFRSHPLVDTAFAPHAPYTVSDAPLERIRTLADELDVPVHIHLHETAGEVDGAVAEHGVRPLARLDRLGLVSPRLMAVHMTTLEDDEVDRLAECGAHVVHCPESNLKLASGFCPVAKLIARGVGVALGTDGAASNNDLDMVQEMRTASLVAKAIARDATAVPAHRAIAMATIAGARALGKDDVIGSLAPGKAADMIAIDLGAIESQPVYDAASQVAYSASRRQVSDVWVAGRALLRDGALLTVDEAGVLERARRWRRRIAGVSP